MTSPTPDRILRIKVVLDRTSLSRATLYRKVAAGTFPRQRKLNTRCAGWLESEVTAWMHNPVYYSVEDHAAAQL